ncbi:MAG: GNAT family N-acetyltransferase [Anaerolineales bacterium]|jgi:hypothetical protein
MKIHQLDLANQKDVDRFVDFPFKLYQDCPQWVPPLISDARKALNPEKHSFYQHSEAAFFLAESEGQTLGRITAMDNRLFNEYRGASTAFFGFFEVIEDQKAAELLFNAVFDWARGRALNRVIGPRGLIGIEGGGILVEGFEHRPAMNIPYNYAYYDDFIQAQGFEKDTDHLSGYLSGNHQLPERLHKIAEKVKQRRGFWIKNFKTKDEMREWIPRVAAVHRQAFSQSHTFYPPTEAEMESISNTIITIADPPLIKLVMKGEQVIGFIFSYHDISAGLQRARGRLWPFGWIHLLIEKRRTKWANVNGVGLLPEYQGLGANSVLYTELEKSIRPYGFEHVDVVQIDEKNFKSFSDMESIGVQWYKRHRAYHRDL